MSRTDEVYKPALEGKKIPVLTLDNKWHQLLSQLEPDKKILRLRDELNELIGRQGKVNTEVKEIKKLKKKLLQDIMENAEDAISGKDQKARKKTEESKRLVNECNEKLEGYEDELLELPGKIDKINQKLMLLTMELCYDALKENEREIEATAKWAARIRVELKKRLVRKQEKEQTNQQIYHYMHDIFGAEVINMFDMKYRGEALEEQPKESQ